REQGPDRGLLDSDERVAGEVVRLGPARVAGSGVELRDVASGPVRGFLFGPDDASHLGDACRGRRVVALEEVTEQRQALDADEKLPQPYVSGHGPTVS